MYHEILQSVSIPIHNYVPSDSSNCRVEDVSGNSYSIIRGVALFDGFVYSMGPEKNCIMG